MFHETLKIFNKKYTYIICPPMVDLPASKSNNIINNRQTAGVIKTKHHHYIGIQLKVRLTS